MPAYPGAQPIQYPPYPAMPQYAAQQPFQQQQQHQPFYMTPGGYFPSAPIPQPMPLAFSSPAQPNFFFSSPQNNFIIAPTPVQISPSPMGFQSNTSSNSCQDKQHRFFKKLDIQIKKYTNAIIEYIKQLQREHTIIIGDIKDHLRNIFGRKSNAKMFGSLATGLAAMSSDMDIAVLGVSQPTSHAMDRLKSVLQEQEAFQDIQIIRKTTVPVIKLKVNLKQLRKSHGLQMQTDSGKADELRLEKSNIYKVDIAFDDTPLDGTGTKQVSNIMKGLKSCQVIKGLIISFYPLKPLVLILKRFLSKFDLNVTYYGGLNSYSLVIMVISLINYYKQSDSKYIGRLLNCFFGFYSNFDYNKYQIQISGSYIPIKKQFMINYDNTNGSTTNHTRSLIVVDPLDQTNNTARASFQFKKIFCYFRAAYEKIQKLINAEIHQDDNKIVVEDILREIQTQQIRDRAQYIHNQLEIIEQSQKNFQEQQMFDQFLGKFFNQTMNGIGNDIINNSSSSSNNNNTISSNNNNNSSNLSIGDNSGNRMI